MKVVTARLLHEDAVLVTVSNSQGSVPREPGAWMLVFAQDAAGTVGGGHVEHEAIGGARAGGARVPVVSFRHAEDLGVVAACLRRLREKSDLPYVGLIGSRAKWATFRHRLEHRGFTEVELARITCPIGIAGITGKQPEV